MEMARSLPAKYSSVATVRAWPRCSKKCGRSADRGKDTEVSSACPNMGTPRQPHHHSGHQSAVVPPTVGCPPRHRPPQTETTLHALEPPNRQALLAHLPKTTNTELLRHAVSTGDPPPCAQERQADGVFGPRREEAWVLRDEWPRSRTLWVEDQREGTNWRRVAGAGARSAPAEWSVGAPFRPDRRSRSTTWLREGKRDEGAVEASPGFPRSRATQCRRAPPRQHRD